MRRLPIRDPGVLRVGAVLTGLLLALPLALAQEPTNRLTQVEVLEHQDTTDIVVKGTRAPTFTVFKLSDPTRLFIDVAGSDIAGIETPIEVGNGVIAQITALQFTDDVVAVGRLIVGLDVDAPYSVKALGNDLVVTVDASARTVSKPVASRPAVGAEAGAAVAAAEVRVREAERQAEQASQRAHEAEDRARLAEERARTADQRVAELAQAREKDSQARGTADVARQSAEVARQSAEAQARDAAAQAAEAAVRAKEAEARAAVAEARAREAEARAAAAESVARTRAAEIEAVSRAGAAGAQDAVEAQGRARSAAQEAADAEARARTAETRSREAEARAAALAKEVAEARSQAQVAEAKAQEAARLAASKVAAADQAAQARIADTETRMRAEAEARASADKAASAKIRAEAEARIQAEAKARLAADQARVAADQAAEARIREANAAAASADARALQAARDAESKAHLATETAQKAQDAAGRLAQAEKRANEAETRAARAEARAARADAEGQRLAAELAALEQQRTDAEAQIARLATEQARLSGELSTARAANDAEKTRVLEAEERAQSAALAAEHARVAQLESARAASALDQRLAGLEAQLETARAADQTDEVKRLQAELSSAQGEGGTLRSALQGRDNELASARSEAERSRAEAARLAAELADARALAQAAQVKDTPVVAAPVVAAPVTDAPVVVAAPVTDAPVVVAAPISEAPLAREALPPVAAVRITNVKFDDSPENTAIRITFSGRPVYRISPEGERSRVLEFQNARIDPALERTLDTSEFQSAVQIVSSFQAPPPGDRVRVVVTLSEPVADTATLNGDTLTWTFGRPRVSRPIAAVPPPPAWSAPPPAAPVKFSQPEAAAFTVPMQPAGAFGSPRRASNTRRYSGRRINIDIKDGDIHNILRLLAKEGNVNIVTSDDVKGTVTVHLKSVPWDQALDIILQTKSLGMVRDGDIVRVAPADVLAKERDLELQQLEVKEKLKPLVVKLIAVNYANASELLNRVKSVLSDRGKAEFDQRTNTVIVKDVRENVEAAEDIVSRLDTQTPQVLIEARIVEVNTVDSLQLGIQWGGNALLSPALGNGTGLRFPSVVGVRGAADDVQAPSGGVSTVPNFVVNLPAAAGGGSGGALGLTFGSIDGAFNLNVRLSAFENRGTVKIVSSPKIATLDNKEATISQGVSIPISQVSAAGTQTVFFDAVLKLVVTPHVTQDGNIYLKIKAENNTPDFQNVGARGDPTILKKEATTELLLKDGDTTVIGGIYTSNAGQNSSEVPYLARIPILGAIFRNYQETDRRTELLIFVTPKIVNRSAAKVRTAN